jgi:hypothetical protein
MPAVTSSSITAGYSAGSATTGSTQTLSVQVATGSVGAATSTGTAVSIAGEATALGTDTFASATATATATDGSAYGTATFAAAATGPDAYATTSATLTPIGTTSRGLSITSTETSNNWTADYAEASSVSFVEFQTVDPLAPLEDFGSGTASTALLPDYADCGCDGGGYDGISIDGNLAVFEFDLSAYGADTFVQADVSAFTLEDMLSTITAVVVVAVG